MDVLRYNRLKTRIVEELLRAGEVVIFTGNTNSSGTNRNAALKRRIANELEVLGCQRIIGDNFRKKATLLILNQEGKAKIAEYAGIEVVRAKEIKNGKRKFSLARQNRNNKKFLLDADGLLMEIGNHFEKSGRNYCSNTSTMKRTIRSVLKVIDKKTGEVFETKESDRTSWHPSILYALVGQEAPDDSYEWESVLARDDKKTLFQYYGNDSNDICSRSLRKQACLAKQVLYPQAVKEQLLRQEKSWKLSEEDWNEYFRVKDLKIEDIENCIRNMMEFHSSIAHLFGKGIGIVCQHIDGKINREIINEVSKKYETYLADHHDGMRTLAKDFDALIQIEKQVIESYGIQTTITDFDKNFVLKTEKGDNTKLIQLVQEIARKIGNFKLLSMFKKEEKKGRSIPKKVNNNNILFTISPSCFSLLVSFFSYIAETSQKIRERPLIERLSRVELDLYKGEVCII